MKLFLLPGRLEKCLQPRVLWSDLDSEPNLSKSGRVKRLLLAYDQGTSESAQKDLGRGQIGMGILKH